MSIKVAVIIGLAVVVAGGLVSLAVVLTAERATPPGRTQPEPASSSEAPAVRLEGVVVLDGAVNGCEGESILIKVEPPVGPLSGSQVVDATLEGLDCVYRFSFPVKQADCYPLEVDGNLVGEYPHGALVRPDGSLFVGYIDSASVWGDPESGGTDPFLADWPHECSPPIGD
jgi:hypothetical protein